MRTFPAAVERDVETNRVLQVHQVRAARQRPVITRCLVSPLPRARSSVEHIPSKAAFPELAPTLLTSAGLPAIRARRKDLAADTSSRQEVVLQGQVDKVTVDSLLHVRDVKVIEGDWGDQHTADVRFEEDLFEEVVDLFRNHATVRIYGYRTGAVGSSERRLELVAIDLAEAVTTG